MPGVREPDLGAAADAALAAAKRADYAGFDPFDLWERPPLAWLLPSPRRLPRRAARAAAVRLAERYPLGLRRLAGTPRRRFPYAIGLFAEALLLRGQALEADELLGWLGQHTVPGGGGWDMGFDYPATVRIMRGTPAVTVALRAYRAFALRGDDEACMAIAHRIASGPRLPAAVGVCFPYTPADMLHVHNANLAAAEMLSDASGRGGPVEWHALAGGALAYWLADWRNGGGFEYVGAEDRTRSYVDHLHPASVIRSLAALAPAHPAAAAALPGAGDTYRDRFFDGNLPVAPHDGGWSDAHSFAEAACALDCLGETAHADRVLSELLRLLGPAPAVAYRIRRADGHVDRTPYIRWSQATAAAALAAASVRSGE